MSWLYAIVIGLIVGFIARALKPGADTMGWIKTCLIGIGGSLLATALGQALGFYRPGEASGFIASIIGAVIVLFVVAMIQKKKT